MSNCHLTFSYYLRITRHHLEGALCPLTENQLFHKHRVWPYSNIHECSITPEEKWVFLLLKINGGCSQFQHQYVKTWKLSLSNKQTTKTRQTENLPFLAPNKTRFHRADDSLSCSIRDLHMWRQSRWNHGLLRTIEWQFWRIWRITGAWVQSNMRSVNCLGLKPVTRVFSFMGFSCSGSTKFPLWGSGKIPMEF